MSEEPRTLADVREEKGLVREQVKVDALVGRKIVVQSIRAWQGRFGLCYTLNLELDGEPTFCVTGATVIAQKLLEVEAELPLSCVVIKEEEYYDIV